MVLQCWNSVCQRKFVWMGHAAVVRTTIAMTACYFVSWYVDWDIPAQTNCLPVWWSAEYVNNTHLVTCMHLYQCWWLTWQLCVYRYTAWMRLTQTDCLHAYWDRRRNTVQSLTRNVHASLYRGSASVHSVWSYVSVCLWVSSSFVITEVYKTLV